MVDESGLKWEIVKEEDISAPGGGGPRITKLSELENDVGYITNKDLPEKYPPSDHKHTKNDITDFPTSLPANGGSANSIRISDTRNEDKTPQDYFDEGLLITSEFKSVSAIGSPVSMTGTYVFIMTITGWKDPSGGYPFQIAFGKEGLAFRYGISRTNWSSWTKIANA